MPLSTLYPRPHYAVIFTSCRSEDSSSEYAQAAQQMLTLAARQPGFLGVDSVRNAQGVGVTVSYWRDLDSIQAWHEVPEHRNVQHLGRKLWYTEFTVRVCRVERSYDFPTKSDEPPESFA
ncbi:MAG: hypothetical protein CBB71_11310 [Rhodopirellula sp. TMED11]|nr:MAG: hypothetical protein CBB71_11310 [Rhodopirellula sp. TMED11]